MLVWGRKTVLQGERGVALLLTLMLMVVFSLLSVSLFEMLRASTQISGNHRFDLNATYIADAGVEDAIDKLRTDPDDPRWQNFSSHTFSGAVTDPTGAITYGTYDPVTIEDLSPPKGGIYDEKKITSTGTVNGFSRTIEAHVWITHIFGTNPPIFTVMTTSWELQ